MNRSHFWKLVLILLVVAWSVSEIYPPTSKNLIEAFEQQSSTPNKTFDEIVKKAQQLDVSNTDRTAGITYSNLLVAISTNDIRPFFPSNYINAAVERDVTRGILNRVQRSAAGQFRLGLDLQGGTQFLLEMDMSRAQTNAGVMMNADFIAEQAVEVLRRRVDRFGVSEPVIAPAGGGRILVQLPGLSESDKLQAKAQIQKAAFLEFRMVHPDSEGQISRGIVPPGYVRLYEMVPSGTPGQRIPQPILVKRTSERGLSGKHVEGAGVGHDPATGSPYVSFSLKPDGAQLFGEITQAAIGERMAIILDGEVVSAPRINGAILGGNGQITGSFTDKEAFELATSLENPLAAPLEVKEERGVDPSLGADAIASGKMATLLGVGGVAAFMIVYYLTAGLVANVALFLNILIMLGVMCSLDVTFTLPGIAGIVLTIGMAVDANVLIYERMREELAAGKSVRGAVSSGYDKAFGTIFDSNLTTLISSVLLIIMGTGPIKGFGVALTVGLCVSMFTALVVTRLIFDFLLAKDIIKTLPMLHIIKGTNIRFLNFAKPAFIASWLLIVVGIGYGVFVRGHNMLGIEFAGGDELQMRFSQRVETEKVRETLSKGGIGETRIQYQTEGAGSTKRDYLSITAAKDAGLKAEEVLKKAFPESKFERVRMDSVGATIGKEIQKSGVIASVLSLFGILVYVAFRYEFSFAVAAVVAVAHDVLMTIGWYCLTGTVGEGRQFNATFVAALLTIIGFSINDTIVIFDRIREDLKMGAAGSFNEIIDRALNQTLSRTIITSGTVFLATISLYVFGGGAINDFAFTFLVGIITGTYSSSYIASALVVWWHKGKRPAMGAMSSVGGVSAAGAQA
ncbi:MAG: protein translocase subunit SecD [Verrucomicrobia bacterium]|nr:protein translocase subunit SecD [Verrucomicrobiota bacterium]